MLRIYALLFAAILTLNGSAVAHPKDTTRAAADRYLELELARDYNALRQLYADDAVFSDPTADVFGDLTQGPVSGAEAIVALQKSWGLTGIRFDEDESFAVGRYSVRRGSLHVQQGDGAPWTTLPFVMVLRVEDRRVTERTDFASYVEPMGLDGPFPTNTAETRRLASEYLRAYLSADLDAQRALLGPDARFQDPTAQVYGPGAGLPLEGAEQILARRAQTFQNVTDFDLEVADSFATNHHAVFMGQTTYTLRNGARFEQPAVFVVEVRDGEVTRHWDFVDYSVGPVG